MTKNHNVVQLPHLRTRNTITDCWICQLDFHTRHWLRPATLFPSSYEAFWTRKMRKYRKSEKSQIWKKSLIKFGRRATRDINKSRLFIGTHSMINSTTPLHFANNKELWAAMEINLLPFSFFFLQLHEFKINQKTVVCGKKSKMIEKGFGCFGLSCKKTKIFVKIG